MESNIIQDFFFFWGGLTCFGMIIYYNLLESLSSYFHKHVCFFCLLCQQNEFEEQATSKVDELLESYMGIRDVELGKNIQMALVFLKQT